MFFFQLLKYEVCLAICSLQICFIYSEICEKIRKPRTLAPPPLILYTKYFKVALTPDVNSAPQMRRRVATLSFAPYGAGD